MNNDTVYALSTAAGKAGVAVFRISGPAALNAVRRLTNLNADHLRPRYAYFTVLHDADGQPADRGLVMYFKAPASFTGEETVEIHSHGSRAVIACLLESLGSLEGFRLAEPGEFSKRAFYNGKMDLTEAEGLADLIDAETREQRKYALRQMDGELKNLYDGWREKLVETLAYLEAYIDFPDEELPDDLVAGLQNTVFKMITALKSHLQQGSGGERLREGFRVVILGEPNAGKSSLLNTLARREAVIVSDLAGTTRDAVDVYMDIDGYPVIFTDTAGLRETDEQIERRGIEIAYDKAENADLIIALLNGENVNPLPFTEVKKQFENKMLYVINKGDKLSDEQCSEFLGRGWTVVSAKYQRGIDVLLQRIKERIAAEFTASSGGLITRRRYREVLNDVLGHLERFNLDKSLELAAEDIRMAARGIGRITGRIEVDEILDKIFGSFCIGK